MGRVHASGAEPPPGRPPSVLEAQVATLQARLARLQDIASALGAAGTPEQVLDVVLTRVIEGVGGRAGSAALLAPDGRTLEVVAAIGYSPEVLAHYRSFDIESGYPLAVAVRTGEPIVHSDPDSFLDAYPPLVETAEGTGTQAWASVPLQTEERVLGALGISFPRPRPFDGMERSFLSSVASQCAQALERARLYRDEATARARAETAQERLEFLAEVSDVLSATLDPQRTMANLAELAVPRLGDWCVVSLMDGRGALVPQTSAHTDAGRAAEVRELVERWPPRLDAAAGAGAVADSGRSELHHHVSDHLLQRLAIDDEHLEALRGLGLGSAMVVPLRARGRTLGTLELGNEAGRAADETDLSLAEEVALRAAVAIDNAQLFAERSHASRRLQESLLPPSLPELPGMDVGASYLAAGSGVDVGGDFYDAVELDGGTWLFFVGDVRGKGIEAASVTGMARHTLRAVAAIAQEPSTTLRQLNSALCRVAAERGEATSDPEFVTVCAIAVRPHAAGARLTVCSAGHPLPLVRRAGGSVETAGTPGTALGILPDPDLCDVTVELGPGDALVGVTDGILERRRGSEQFEDEVATVLANLGCQEAGTLATKLRGEAEAYSPQPPGDDMAVLVLRVPEAGERPSPTPAVPPPQ